MRQGEHEFILNHIRRDILDRLHKKSVFVDICPEHPDPDRRRMFVVTMDDVDEVVKIVFNQLEEE